MYVNFDIGKFRAMVNSKGHIIAYEKTAQHRKIETNVNAFVNDFPCEDRDFIIMAGRQKLFDSFGIRRRDLDNFYGTI